MRRLLRTPGLAAAMVASVITVTAGDLIVIYLPLLGAERSIDVNAIGGLLTMRAAASMLARLIYVRLMAAFGRVALMVASLVLGRQGVRRARHPDADRRALCRDVDDRLQHRHRHHDHRHQRGGADRGRRPRNRQFAAGNGQPHRPGGDAVRSEPGRGLGHRRGRHFRHHRHQLVGLERRGLLEPAAKIGRLPVLPADASRQPQWAFLTWAAVPSAQPPWM